MAVAQAKAYKAGKNVGQPVKWWKPTNLSGGTDTKRLCKTETASCIIYVWVRKILREFIPVYLLVIRSNKPRTESVRNMR